MGGLPLRGSYLVWIGLSASFGGEACGLCSHLGDDDRVVNRTFEIDKFKVSVSYALIKTNNIAWFEAEFSAIN